MRVAVLGTERARRHPLHLSWVEVRRRGQLHRHAKRAAASGFQAQGEGKGVSHRGTRGTDLGLYGVAHRTAIAGARNSGPPGGRDDKTTWQEAYARQLTASLRELATHH